MNDVQSPAGFGFGRETTADRVLAGRDLTGQTALVTGGHSGLGLATTRALSKAGADVIVIARDLRQAEIALTGIPGVEIVGADLADLASTKLAARHILSHRRPIDFLIASAGIMACPETRVGDGWEAQFAVNHLGHFALVTSLWPGLADAARVVMVSSGAHRITPIRWDDIHFATGYDRWVAYGQSKTANVLFAVGLDARGQERGIRAFAVHPGSILTPLQRHLSHEEMVASGWIHEDGSLADPSFKTPEQGAATQVWAATSTALAGRGGLYCEDCDVAPVAGPDGGPGVAPYAIDPAEADRLWELSVRLTGVNI